MEGLNKKTVKVGSRKSQLALIQTNSVIKMLKDIKPNLNFEIITMTTTGDKILDTALSKIGEKSLFTKELENALLDNTVDFVVHSLKDLPTVLPEGMGIGAVCKRDDPRDVVVMHQKHKDQTLKKLPKGSVVGTSSLRRAAQIRRNFPHLVIKDVRGNLNTRFRKLDDADDYDCLVLAYAGLDRMSWQDRASHILDPSECMYSVSQGAMAVECRAKDVETLELLSSLHHYPTLLQIIAERAFLRTMEGGCHAPVAVCTTCGEDKLTLEGGVFSIDGTEAVLDELTTELPAEEEPSAKRLAVGLNVPEPSKALPQYSCVIATHQPQEALRTAENLGVSLAKKVIENGGQRLLDEAKKQTEAEIRADHAAKQAQKAKQAVA